MLPTGNTTQLDQILSRFRDGEQPTQEMLLALAFERLRALTRKFLNGYPSVRRFEQTDDVLQNAAIRLSRALESVHPQSAREFWGLAAIQIRRELVDLARHYYGPLGEGANRADVAAGTSIRDDSEKRFDPTDPTDGPHTLSEWTELHALVQELPDRERETFDLLYYGGLSQSEAANVLDVDVRTVKRRWRAARLVLHQALGGHRPGR